MSCKSLAKDFHRLLKRIGPLTEGQASVDTVDWDNDTLTSFRVIIRPNGGIYKMGRFKFTVSIPDGYLDGVVPVVRCDTQLPHPNIDPWMDEGSNICLNLFHQDNWTPSLGLEGIVLGILFLLHNPNFDDVLCEEFPEGIFDDDFEEGVREYMATGEVDGYEYETDFRVVDGKFIDLKKEAKEQTSVDDSNTGGDKIEADSVITCPYVDGVDDDNFDAAINPVRFVMTNDTNDGRGAFFYTTFTCAGDESDQLVKDVHNETTGELCSDSNEGQDVHSSDVHNPTNGEEAMDSDDPNPDTCQLPDHSSDLHENTKENEMDCSENKNLNNNKIVLDSIVRPLQRTVTVFDLSESGFSTFMSRSMSLPTSFHLANFQPTFLTSA